MKKTASKSRPLSLKRETVRTLDSSQLASAQGGDLVVRITGGDDRDSDCIICRIYVPPVNEVGSAGSAGGCNGPWTGISRVIYP
jgi:hypothetical protein